MFNVRTKWTRYCRNLYRFTLFINVWRMHIVVISLNTFYYKMGNNTLGIIICLKCLYICWSETESLKVFSHSDFFVPKGYNSRFRLMTFCSLVLSLFDKLTQSNRKLYYDSSDTPLLQRHGITTILNQTRKNIHYSVIHSFK